MCDDRPQLRGDWLWSLAKSRQNVVLAGSFKTNGGNTVTLKVERCTKMIVLLAPPQSFFGMSLNISHSFRFVSEWITTPKGCTPNLARAFTQGGVLFSLGVREHERRSRGALRP